ncbi:TldD/PmbA family protein [Mycoplasmatota bacterium]|nr:TldD/PmbA family protein [Mycoplasmatota bacterium]
MRLDRLIEILNNSESINGWKLEETNQKSYELYYIRRDLEMNRAKNIHNIRLTVYKDFDIDGVEYKGSSVTKLHPTMTEEEIIQAINNAAYASQFAKVLYYPLVKPSEEKLEVIESNFKEKPIEEYLSAIVEAIFKVDVYEKGSINSTEIFITKLKTRLVNSCGIDYSSEKYLGTVEFITNWKEEKEEIELFQHIDFGDMDSEKLTQEVKEMLEMSRARAISKSTPALGKHRVILSGESVKQMMEYYYNQSATGYVYEKFSTAKIGESIQGDEIKGDKLSITLKPCLSGSIHSAVFDNDGVILKEVNIIKDGIIKSLWGNQRYSYYLDLKPTGVIRNMEVMCGKKSIKELKKDPYLEVVSFSSFQLDDFTGYFGGEIRLGWYYDGNEIIPVSGGSISGNIKDKHGEMYLSSEKISINEYLGPKHMVINDVTVAGN